MKQISSRQSRANRFSSGQPDQRWILGALLLAAAAFYAFFILRSSFNVHGRRYFTLIDDAMISMRYAQHFARGDGLVWNVGQEPVQGFTNPAWTLLMAIPHALGLPDSRTSLAVMIVSAMILLLLILVVHRTCLTVATSGRFAPPMAAAITAFYFPLVFWSLRGMEVGWLSLVISGALLLTVQLEGNGSAWLPIGIGVLLALALATRLDAVVQVAVLFVYVITRRHVPLRQRLLPCILTAITLIGVFAFQRLYFGDALPNTYYQKLVGTTALARIKVGLLAFIHYAARDTLILAFVSGLGMVLYRQLRSPQTALLAALFLGQCAYSVWVGGDYAEPEVDAANRFITQGIPPLIILFSLGTERILSDAAALREPARGPAQAAIPIGIAIAVLAVISGPPWVHWTTNNAPLLKADIRRVRAGVAIAGATSPDATIAVHAAGQIPYYSGRTTIDLLGLNDPVIAKGPLAGPFYPGHDKWNYDYSIMQLTPDLIADNWIRLGDYMRDKREYTQLDNGMYVRQDTALVDVPALVQAFP